ncbi:MAG TPA: tRNA pseudouridine(55) synthase TruB [Candidatus Dormibacteraeota bacterium]|nr:tRNA pseudouridine(55) synthase TruB [Candidatus Dormibacteraeota bacterium]
MNGILLVDKPAGWTSFDVVNYVRRSVANSLGKRPKSLKVGHTGTLDPFATGLLVLLIGKEYTKQATLLSRLDKSYEVSMILGKSSTTGDPEGEISFISDRRPKLGELEAVLKRFEGQIEQTPPKYSAIKINGQRAYRLARNGEEVVIKPRQVTIRRLKLTNYDYPNAYLTTDVSSGTYIRALVEDIAKNLQTVAYTSALRRTKVGQFSLIDAVSMENISPEVIAKNLKQSLE